MAATPGEFTTTEALGVIDDIAAAASPVMVLSGGEPLLRKDLFEIADYGTRRGLRVCLATNGTLVDETVCKSILETGVRMVSLSIDGATPGIHDDFRGQPGAFRGVMGAAALFRRFGVPFLINSSFTKRNQAEIPKVYRLARELGAKAWYMFMVVPTGRAEDTLEELISAEDYESILHWHYEQELQETQILMRPTCAPQYYRVVRERSRREGREWKPRSLQFATGVSKGCLAGQHIAFIDRLGRVLPCSYFPEPAGDLRREPFGEIWKSSPLFLALRDFGGYEGRCGRCEYLRVCGGCRARSYALREGNFLAEDPFCTHEPRSQAREHGGSGRLLKGDLEP